MVGFVWKNGATFLFSFSIFVEKWWSYRWFGWRLKMKYIQDLFCIIYLSFQLFYRMYSHPVVRQRAGNQEVIGLNLSVLPFAFSHIFLSFLLLAHLGFLPWVWVFFYSLISPCLLISRSPYPFFLIFWFPNKNINWAKLKKKRFF